MPVVEASSNGSGQKHCVPFGSVSFCKLRRGSSGEQGSAGQQGSTGQQGSWPKSSRSVWGRHRVAQSVCKTFAICLREINATQIICAKVLLVAVFTVSILPSSFSYQFPSLDMPCLLPHFLQLNSKNPHPLLHTPVSIAFPP